MNLNQQKEVKKNPTGGDLHLAARVQEKPSGSVGGTAEQENNKKALDLLRRGTTSGEKEAVKFMFSHPETGRQLSYSEMRSYYG